MVVIAAVFMVGVAGVGWTLHTWREDITCEGMPMGEGDTCAHIKTKTYRNEADTPAEVRPVRRPAQPPGARMRSIQQVHVRDVEGMRADNQREAIRTGLICFGACLACGYIFLQVVRQSPSQSSRTSS